MGDPNTAYAKERAKTSGMRIIYLVSSFPYTISINPLSTLVGNGSLASKSLIAAHDEDDMAKLIPSWRGEVDVFEWHENLIGAGVIWLLMWEKAPELGSRLILGVGCGVVPKVPSTLCRGCPKECHSGRYVGPGFWSRRLKSKEDSVSWKGGKNGKFGVKKGYSLLISPSVSIFPRNGIWVENVPTKLAFFAWEAA
ncbi:hypothetical protein CK203_035679 [Vitis vinifera]|uniref:Uncharacterized protein n=1 Tax=Vitis vinifera TaxID=29760 RepID=A0A438ICS5_VITVI|nr:hypothetical protein CK203_035679 [Vitis vinifera]